MMKLVDLITKLDMCKIRIFDYFDLSLTCFEYCSFDDCDNPKNHYEKWEMLKDYYVKFVTCNDDYIYIFISKYSF